MIDDDRIESDLPDWPGSEDPASPPLSTVDAADLLALPSTPPTFAIEHIVPTGALVLLSGDTGSAKTALAIHIAVAAVTSSLVARMFAVAPDLRVLYVNGEMGRETIVRYLHEAAAGLGVEIPRGRLYFEGVDAVATWRFMDDRAALEQLVADLRPDVLVLDTMRALMIENESDQPEVRRAFAWLRSRIVNQYGTSVIIAHHLRKVGPVSNASRERVAGSRDIIASVDVHLAAKARDGGPMHAIRLDKTRMPLDGVGQGTEWPIEARLEASSPNRSTFTASAPISAATAANASAEERAVDEIRARLEAEGPLTIEAVGAKTGTGRRAWKRLMAAGELVEAGKDVRKTLYALKATVPEADDLWEGFSE